MFSQAVQCQLGLMTALDRRVLDNTLSRHTGRADS